LSDVLPGFRANEDSDLDIGSIKNVRFKDVALYFGCETDLCWKFAR